MDYIYIGKIVNTHGIKGELRIISNFEYKDKVFKENNLIYIGKDKEEKEINSYRTHKQYDMVTFKDVSDINEVLIYKGMDVFIKKEDLKLNKDEILDSDLINMEVYFNDKLLGVIDEIIDNNGYKLLNINNLLIPYNNNFIEKINKENNKIILKNVEELIK